MLFFLYLQARNILACRTSSFTRWFDTKKKDLISNESCVTTIGMPSKRLELRLQGGMAISTTETVYLPEWAVLLESPMGIFFLRFLFDFQFSDVSSRFGHFLTYVHDVSCSFSVELCVIKGSCLIGKFMYFLWVSCLLFVNFCFYHVRFHNQPDT